MNTLQFDRQKAEAEAHRLRAEHLAGILAACARPLRRAVARVKYRIAIGRAEAHLRTLPDAALKDMGITRDQIHMAVRHGRDVPARARTPVAAEPRQEPAAGAARWA